MPKARRRENRPEPRTREGDVLLSHNHLALLHGLYDRPNGQAESRNDWIRAALPYIRQIKEDSSAWRLFAAMPTIHPSWVTERRQGRRVVATLTERGREIVERKLRSRVRGHGPYLGMASISSLNSETISESIDEPELRRVISYAKAFGLPLLSPPDAHYPSGRVFAVSRGLDGPFTVMTREELELCGPRQWHYEWIKKRILSLEVPSRFRERFAEYEEDDVADYLSETAADEASMLELYLTTYGRPLLSQNRIDKFMKAEIDMFETDMSEEDILECVRTECGFYKNAAAAIGNHLTWLDPDSRKQIGSAYIRKSASSADDILVSTPAALACLQRHFDRFGLGIRIETRYLSRDDDSQR
jgi:hypothetical protein